MKFRVFTLLILSINWFVEHVRCSKILVFATTPTYSHHVNYPPLLLELTSRGHEIVLVTAAPTSSLDVPNIKQIDISQVFKTRKNLNSIGDRFNGVSWLSSVEDKIIEIFDLTTEEIFKHPQMKQLYKPNSNANFDLVILEMFYSTSLLALGHRFDAPTMGYSPMGIPNIYDYICGAPVFTSHESNWEIEQNAGPNLSFWQRLQNFAKMWRHIYLQYNYFIPRQQLMAEKYLGPGVPPMLDLIRNISVVFINADEVLNPARPRCQIISYIILLMFLPTLHHLQRYKERMLQVRDLIKDKPYDTAKHFAWWTEFVIRHKGAAHLRTTLGTQPWYQRLDMDVIVFLTLVTFIILSIITIILTKLIITFYKQRKGILYEKQKIN
nr:LOW QUALITY PROTEIN: UDP-glucuronosyltransferase 2B18-like [Nomia melanderi]